VRIDPEQITTGPELYNHVRAGFTSHGTSFHRWCNENDVSRQNATTALLGGWRGPKATALIKRIIDAAGLDPEEESNHGH